jgi:RNA polymerase sigma-70 factor (ECF subfamily)
MSPLNTEINFLDSETISKLFDLYANPIFKYSLRICGDSILADQIVGDVFSQLIEKYSQGKGPKTNIRAYLYQIAYHRIVDHFRENRRIASLDNMEIKAEEQSVPANVEYRDFLMALDIAMKVKLSKVQQQVIVLRFQEGFSLEETARIIGKNSNSVKALQNRAMEKLQKILKEPFSEDEMH